MQINAEARDARSMAPPCTRAVGRAAMIAEPRTTAAIRSDAAGAAVRTPDFVPSTPSTRSAGPVPASASAAKAVLQVREHAVADLIVRRRDDAHPDHHVHAPA